MVLGIRSKRKSVSVQVHYIIHVQEIKPWPPSQSLTSAQSVVLQWEAGDKSSGSLLSSYGDGKIEINESFRLSVLLWRESSKRGKLRDSFQKNFLDFYLYEHQNDKTAKSQLLGSATINIADYGVIKETTSIYTQVNCKRSFRKSALPILYINIQPFDVEGSDSSPKSNFSKELSLDKEESESASQLNDEDVEIASFTDDESDDISPSTSQTVGSASETTGDSVKISEVGTEGLNKEIVPIETTSASSHIKAEAGASFHSSSMVFSSNTGNATYDRSSSPKFPEEGFKVDDASSRSPESASPHMKAKSGVSLHSSSVALSSDTGSGTYDRSSSPKFPEECVNVADASFKIPESASSRIKAEPGASKQFSGTELHSSSMTLSSDTGNATYDRPSSPKFPEKHVKVADASSKFPKSARSHIKAEAGVARQFSGSRLRSSSMVLSPDTGNTTFNRAYSPKFTEEHVKIADANSKIPENIQRFNKKNMTDGALVKSLSSASYIPVVLQSNTESSSQYQVIQEDSMSEKNGNKGHGYDKDSPEKINSVLTSLTLPLDTAESYGLFSKNQPEENSTLNDDHVGVACHSGTNVRDSFPDIRTELKFEVQMLRDELREAAALEVSLYSIVAEHGSSANKIHAPARRLSRLYLRVGSPAARASAAQSAVSGFVLVSKACGNDVPRLTFWLSNLILLRAIISRGVEKIRLDDSLSINSQCDRNGSVEGSSLKTPSLLREEEKENTVKHVHGWEDPQTFVFALEKIEAWIFSRIVESVWWQTLTPHMQSAAAKSSSSRKTHGRKHNLGDQEQGSISIELWISAFKDACERLCPLRAGGHVCGCLPVIARLVMEQLLNRLDVAMFNAILRESAEEMPTDPISDPISDSKVLPIPAGKSGFGAGVQLKNAIGNWSRWLSDLFDIDDSVSPEDRNENDGNKSPECETSFKAFPLLHSLSDLMMLPFEMLADGSQRKEICPTFGVPLIKRVLYNFVPDEFCPGPIPDAVLEALNTEEIQDDERSISSFPCIAAPAFYAPPPAASVMGIIQEIGAQTSVVKKSYTSDDELDDLDSPLTAIGIDDPSLAYKKKFTAVTGGRNAVRYELLREVWRDSE